LDHQNKKPQVEKEKMLQKILIF